MATREVVLDTLVDIIGSEQVRQNLDLRLYDLGLLDSFKTVELMVMLSDRLGRELSPAEFDRESWATPRAIIEALSQKIDR
jgi:D-alanine--poly(phosphoribitol) ligase subunit 2